MRTKYQQGTAFERRIINSLRQYNFHVIRSAGSKGIVDIAFFPIINVDGKTSPRIFEDKYSEFDVTMYYPSVAQLKTATGWKEPLSVISDCSDLTHLTFKTQVNKFIFMCLGGELLVYRYDLSPPLIWKQQKILVDL